MSIGLLISAASYLLIGPIPLLQPLLGPQVHQCAVFLHLLHRTWLPWLEGGGITIDTVSTAILRLPWIPGESNKGSILAACVQRHLASFGRNSV